MKSNVGLWIDHRKAVIVRLTDRGEEIHEVPSHMEKHVRFSGGAQETSAEDQRDRRFTGHLNKYYDEIVSRVSDAHAVLILGPGEAKVELKTRLESRAFGGRITGIETADKMTDGQLAARVREHFLHTAVDIRSDREH